MLNPLLILKNANLGVAAVASIVTGVKKIVPKRKNKYELEETNQYNLSKAIQDIGNAINRIETIPSNDYDHSEMKRITLMELHITLNKVKRL